VCSFTLYAIAALFFYLVHGVSRLIKLVVVAARYCARVARIALTIKE
jgi:hypothetical protein